MIVRLKDIIFEPRVRGLCCFPYPGHPHGCPNFGHRPGCPPRCPMIHQRLDLMRPTYAIVNAFDLETHVARMRERHPAWSQRQLECCLYWQPSARKGLGKEITRFLLLHLGDVVDCRPEAGGVNVTETLCRAGIILEWPPKKIARQIAIGGWPSESAAGWYRD